MSAAILGALKYLPASVARKALTKFNPKFENYFSKALSYGIDANRALDYLSEKFESDAQKSHKNQLDQGATRHTLRPDEAVSRSEMTNAAIPGKILKGAASLAIGGGLGNMGEKKEPPSIRGQILPAESPNQPSSPRGIGYEGNKRLNAPAQTRQLTDQRPLGIPVPPDKVRKHTDNELARIEALKKFNEKVSGTKKKKASLAVEDLEDQFNKGYGQQENNVDDALLAALQKILQM